MDGEAAADGTVEALDPAVLQAAARMAIRANDGMVVLRMAKVPQAVGTRESVPVPAPSVLLDQ